MIPKKHYRGEEYFRFPSGDSLTNNDYFTCMKLVKFLLEDFHFSGSTLESYISLITNIGSGDDNKNSLRIIYYTTNPIKTGKAIKKFEICHSSKIKTFKFAWTIRPHESLPSPEQQDAIGLRFRSFANINNKVVLELVDYYGENYLQNLVDKYKRIFISTNMPPALFLGLYWEGGSKYFQKLKTKNMDKQYWQDLIYPFPQGIGMHFLSNMIALPNLQYMNWVI